MNNYMPINEITQMTQLNSCRDTNETDGRRNTKAIQTYNKHLNEEIKNFL